MSYHDLLKWHVKYLEFLFFLKHDILAYGGRDEDEAEHDDERQLGLDDEDERVGVVGGVGELFQPRVRQFGTCRAAVQFLYDAHVYWSLQRQKSLLVIT